MMSCMNCDGKGRIFNRRGEKKMREFSPKLTSELLGIFNRWVGAD